MLICTSCQPRALWNAWHDPPLFQAPPPSHVSAPHVRAPPQVGMTRCMGADGVGGCHTYPSPPPTYTPRIKLIHSEDHIYEGTSGLCRCFVVNDLWPGPFLSITKPFSIQARCLCQEKSKFEWGFTWFPGSNPDWWRALIRWSTTKRLHVWSRSTVVL